MKNHPSNISSAFEWLHEMVERDLNCVNDVGAKAVESRDCDKARAV